LPTDTGAVIVFANGSGSGRFSRRDQYAARVLQGAGLSTLLIDLLDQDEAEDRTKVVDTELLAYRLGAGAAWLARDADTRGLRLGYFGVSTGAAAALVAAARQPEVIGAVVCRGGRPDRASAELPDVTAPTLLIVGSNDQRGLELNSQALALLRCTKQLVVVPGATYLFPEPWAQENVARLAARWFLQNLGSGTTAACAASETASAGDHDELADRFRRSGADSWR